MAEAAREDAALQWADSCTALLAGPETHALVVAMRDQAESGRFLEGRCRRLVPFAFAELGFRRPPPPERAEDAQAAAAEASMDEGATSTSGASVPADGAKQPGRLHSTCQPCREGWGSAARHRRGARADDRAHRGRERLRSDVHQGGSAKLRGAAPVRSTRLSPRLLAAQDRPSQEDLSARTSSYGRTASWYRAADGMDAASGPEA